MNTYRYLSISWGSFLAFSYHLKREGFFADDEEGRTWETIRKEGYRLMCFNDGRAVFEKKYDSTEGQLQEP